LQRWNLEQLAASFLEAGAPLTVIGAQLIYLSEPLFRRTPWQGQVLALEKLLDDPQNLRHFIHLLQEAQVE
jgi:hypothetical protein